MLTNANKYQRFVYLSPCFGLVCPDLHEANGHLLTECRIYNRDVMIYGESRGWDDEKLDQKVNLCHVPSGRSIRQIIIKSFSYFHENQIQMSILIQNTGVFLVAFTYKHTNGCV